MMAAGGMQIDDELRAIGRNTARSLGVLARTVARARMFVAAGDAATPTTAWTPAALDEVRRRFTPEDPAPRVDSRETHAAGRSCGS